VAGFLNWILGRISADEQIGLEDYIERQEPLCYDAVVGSQRPPNEAGIYAWFFDWRIPSVCRSGCFGHSTFKLLYIGQASNLRRRIVNCHFKGSADVSTLRLTLGCLLEEVLPAKLSVTWRGRWTFSRDGEKRLSEWMRLHARVTWIRLHDKFVDWPSTEGEGDEDVLDRAERRLIKSFWLPLNLAHNREAVCGVVKRIREQCMHEAKG